MRTVEFLSKALRKVGVNAADVAEPTEAKNKKTRQVLRKIFEDLKSLSEARAIQPVLVYLPALHELMGNRGDSEEWLEFLKSESKAFEIPLFDVVSDFRRLAAHEVVRPQPFQ